jgi:subtilisin family serine protease
MMEFEKQEEQDVYGLAYPAICRYAISAGAVFNKNRPPFSENDVAPFTQRLETLQGMDQTYILAPAVDTVSCGIKGPDSYTRMTGSSQAAAVLTGTILLIQHKYGNITVDQIKDRLRDKASMQVNKAGNAIIAKANARGRAGILSNYFDDKKYRILDAAASLQ